MSLVCLSRNKPVSSFRRRFGSKKCRPPHSSLVSAMSWLSPGKTVYVTEAPHVERLHEFNKLPWNKKEHHLWQGKVGVIEEIAADGDSATVKFFEWAVSQNEPSGGKKLLEVDVVWHTLALKPAAQLHFINGDRPILQQVSAEGKKDFHHVSLRVVENNPVSGPVYSLRTTKMHTFTWSRSERPNDILLPVYLGRDLSRVMRERSSALSDLAADCSASRVLHGPLEGEEGKQLERALMRWREDGGAHFKAAVQKFPEQLTTSDKNLLLLAVEDGNWAATVVLISMGSPREATDSKGNTLLHAAALRGHVHILEGLLMFIEKEINRTNADGDTALHVASRGLHAACVDRLLSTNSIQTNIQNTNGDSVLHVVCGLAETSASSAILGRILGNPRANPNLINTDGLTAMQLAIVRDNAKCVEMLIQSRPNILAVDSRTGVSPLLWAASHGKKKIVDTLLQVKLDHSSEQHSATNSRGRTALHMAVERWHGQADKDLERLATVQSLVSIGVSVNAVDCDGMTACHLLMTQINRYAHNVDRKTMRTVMQCNKSNMKLDEMTTKLRPHWHLACLCYLTSRGADFTIRNNSGESVIECCVSSELQDTMKDLTAQRSKTCLPMTSTLNDFDTSEVHMCTFNCEDSVADVQFMPCGHRVVCKECALSMPLKRCPMCYGIITTALTIDGTVVDMGSALRPSPEDMKILLAEKEKKRVAEEAANKAKQDAEIEKKREIQALREKLEQLEMETSCSICMDSRPSIVFNCGHTACGDCTEHLKLCHICREPISKKQTIYA